MKTVKTAKIPTESIVLGPQLSSGTNWTIFRAVTNDERPILVKFHSTETRSGRRSPLEHEESLFGFVDSPCIAKSLGIAQFDENRGMILNDAGGVPISQLRNDSSVTMDTISWMAIAIASALKALHSADILHQAITSQCILVNLSSEIVQLVDLSNALQCSAQRTDFSPLTSLANLQYLAPEQTGRVNRQVDTRTDLYSFGIVLYELATGKTPFEGLSGIELVHAHIASKPNSRGYSLRDGTPMPSELRLIIARLLEKDPEDRYQSATGVFADLEAWSSYRHNPEQCAQAFELGSHDRPTRLYPVQDLIGRDAEVKSLSHTFNAVRGGNSGLSLIVGPSGIGKTALVRELYRPLTVAFGTFIGGKYDQVRHDAPYSAVIQALNQFCRQLLAEDEPTLKHWRSHLNSVLGKGASALSWLLPDLGSVLSIDSSIVTQPTGELSRLLSRMLISIAVPERPVILFLDDCQWADEASLNLFRELAEIPGIQYLHLVGSYRAEEIDDSHELLVLAAAWKAQGVRVHDVKPAPLTIADVNRIISHTVRCAPNRSVELATVVHGKTQGNPFFVVELLGVLSDRHLIRYSDKKKRWEWNVEEILREHHTDNVIELVATRLNELDPTTLEILQTSACLGNGVCLELLGIATDTSQHVLLSKLTGAERESLIRIHEISGEHPHSNKLIRLSFAHDRIQQVAYEKIPDICNLQLTIGRRLMSFGTLNADDDPRLFLTLNQLNHQADKLSTAEKTELARWNALASLRTQKSGALALALSFAETGLSLLGANPWDLDYTLSLELHSSAAEAAAGTAKIERVEQLAKAVTENTKNSVDANRVWCAQVRVQTTHGVPANGVAIGIKALSKLGFTLQKPSEAAFAPILVTSLQTMTDKNAMAAIRLLAHMGSGAYVGDRESFAPIVVTMTQLLRNYGASPWAGPGVAWTTTLLLSQRRYAEAHQWGDVADQLMNKFDTRDLICQTRFLTVVSAGVARDHLKNHVERFSDVLQFSVETGNFEFVGWAVLAYVQNSVLGGRKLSEISLELPDLIQQVKISPVALTAVRVWAQVVENLSADVENPTELKGNYLDWKTIEKAFLDTDFIYGLSFLTTARIFVAVYMGDYKQASQIANKSDHLREGELGISGFLARCFYVPAARLFALPSGTAEKHTEEIALAKLDIQELRLWSETAPHNANHKILLLEAELLRIDGDFGEALTIYDRAIESAQKSGYDGEIALAYERCASLCSETGRTTIAREFLSSACSFYRSWGAQKKVQMLLTTSASPIKKMGSKSNIPDSALNFDLETVAKASRSLSRIVDRSELSRTLVGLALENAGAEFGCYLSYNTSWTIEAHGGLRSGELLIHSGPDTNRVCWPAVNYARRTGRTLILENASNSEFSEDSYVQEHNVTSLLCLPVKGTEGVTGVLCLENNLVEGAFTKDRVEVLTLLAAQLAVSLENASLYGELRTTIAELEQLNSQLEDFVHITSHDLREPLRTIGSYAQLLKLSQDSVLDEQSSEFVDWIVRGVERMSTLLDDVRDYTESANKVDIITAVDLNLVCKDVCEQLASTIEDKQAQVEWSALPIVFGQKSDYCLLLQNLVANAIKFSGPNPPQISIYAEKHGYDNIVVVDDNGIGLEPQFREKIFERFQRLHAQDEYEGSGLGLAACRRTAERIGGRIWCEESQAGGASFRFIVPTSS